MPSPITTHVLDLCGGKPAAGVPIVLEHFKDGDWEEIGRGETNADGRVSNLMHENTKLVPGEYRLVIDTGNYFSSQAVHPFHPYVSIAFRVQDQSQHYHIPLLVSPYGYATYRGS